VDAPARAEFIAPTATHVPLGTCGNEALSKIPVATKSTEMQAILSACFFMTSAPRQNQ
jgi:hypothetical protein